VAVLSIIPPRQRGEKQMMEFRYTLSFCNQYDSSELRVMLFL
jgi:hypothetical protein